MGYTKQKKVVIGKEKVPAYLNTAVLIKALGGEENLREMWSKYKEHRTVKGLQKPTELQYKIANARRDGGMVAELVRKFNVQPHQVYNSVNRVSMWEYMVVNKPKSKKA